MTTPAFYDAVRPLFGGKLTQSQVDGLAALVGATAGLATPYRAYLIATAQHETAHTMLPVRETLAKTDDQAIARLETAWRKGKLKAVKTPYWRKDSEGKTWLGRGYVQLTHKANYQKASALTGIDLVANPSAAMRPDAAAKILVQGCLVGMFTGKRLSNYLDGPNPDYVGARRVVNGADRAQTIASLARTYERALGHLPAAPAPVIDAPVIYAPVIYAPPPVPVPTPLPATTPVIDAPAPSPDAIDTPVAATPAPAPGLMARLRAALAALFGRA